jgi:hypothetical protein
MTGNELINSGFEAGNNPWVLTGTYITTDDKCSGTHSLYVPYVSPQASAQQYISKNLGTVYTRIRYKPKASPYYISNGVLMHIAGGGSAVYSVTDNNGSVSVSNPDVMTITNQVNLPNGWKEIVVRITHAVALVDTWAVIGALNDTYQPVYVDDTYLGEQDPTTAPPTGKGIEGVLIEVYKEGDKVKEGLTDSDGKWVDTLEAGDYYIRLSKSGLQTIEKNETLVRDTELMVNLPRSTLLVADVAAYIMATWSYDVEGGVEGSGSMSTSHDESMLAGSDVGASISTSYETSVA